MLYSHLSKITDPAAPKFVFNNLHYEVITGSRSYGCNTPESDYDIYGFCIPPKEMVFPHLAFEIDGFGTRQPKFHQFISSNLVADDGKVVEMQIFNIVRYFQLCMENNPNMLDSLFTPKDCIIKSTNIGNLVYKNRKMFLHKGLYTKFKGYAASQISKIKNKHPVGKRVKLVELFGYDTKYALHLIRLLGECEQLLTIRDMDLKANYTLLLSIRNGEWLMEDIFKYFDSKIKELDKLFDKSLLPDYPDEVHIKGLLFTCLDMEYGKWDERIKK